MLQSELQIKCYSCLGWKQNQEEFLSLAVGFLSTVLLKWEWKKYRDDTGVDVGEANITETGSERYTAVPQYVAMWERAILHQSEVKP